MAFESVLHRLCQALPTQKPRDSEGLCGCPFACGISSSHNRDHHTSQSAFNDPSPTRRWMEAIQFKRQGEQRNLNKRLFDPYEIRGLRQMPLGTEQPAILRPPLPVVGQEPPFTR